jgi:hypothetical protein
MLRYSLYCTWHLRFDSEFKETRAVDENITVKLKGLKSLLHRQ